MKSNNELEAKDLRIDDLEVDDEWQQVIVAYMETWFDVDRKFHLSEQAKKPFRMFNAVVLMFALPF